MKRTVTRRAFGRPQKRKRLGVREPVAKPPAVAAVVENLTHQPADLNCEMPEGVATGPIHADGDNVQRMRRNRRRCQKF